MRKAKSEVTPLMNRIENLARKEHRNIVGQLTHILETYEKVTGISGKRPYQRKPKELAQEKTLKKRKVVASKGVMKPRKVRKDKGGTHNMSQKGRKNIAAAQKLRHARVRLLERKKSSTRS